MNLVFASSNANKIKEISDILPSSFIVSGLKDIGINEEIPETGKTFRENSFMKAKYVIDFLNGKTKAAVLADDSGLEVQALNGNPGVLSARYAGIPKDDKKNNEKLLNELKNIPNRNARFVTVITLIIDHEIHYFEGEVKGTIAHKLSGETGFGYDPLFIPQGYTNTFAELGKEIKNAISHRAIAVKKLKEFLQAR